MNGDFSKGIAMIISTLLVLAVFLFFGFIVCGYYTYKYFYDNKIETTEILIPEKKLRIVNNRVDTLYIYKYGKR